MVAYEEIAGMIDHSLLIPVLSDRQLEDGCRLALNYDVATVCIKPYYLKRCAERLAGSNVKPTTTIPSSRIWAPAVLSAKWDVR